MKIFGMGIPELLILGPILLVMALIVTVIVVLVRRSSSSAPVPPTSFPVDDAARRSAAAYQRLAQLDDLRKRGVLTEEEFMQKKQEVLTDL